MIPGAHHPDLEVDPQIRAGKKCIMHHSCVRAVATCLEVIQWLTGMYSGTCEMLLVGNEIHDLISWWNSANLLSDDRNALSLLSWMHWWWTCNLVPDTPVEKRNSAVTGSYQMTRPPHRAQHRFCFLEQSIGQYIVWLGWWCWFGVMVLNSRNFHRHKAYVCNTYIADCMGA